MPSLLKIRQLTIEALDEGAWKPIVDKVDLNLKRGEVLGLIGESGAGKSTIGLAPMGYTRPGCRIKSGSIEFDGLDVINASEEERRKLRGVRIAYVAQSAAASFNPAYRIINQFIDGPLYHKLMKRVEAENKAYELYEQLKLPDSKNIGFRYPHQVSGGQLQRMMVAMAMSCDPELIVFDEPTTALDVTTQIEVLAAIKDAIKTHHKAALYITHDLAVVSQVVDRIMVLRYGKIVEENTTNAIIKQPKKDYTIQLLNARSNRCPKNACCGDEELLLKADNIFASYDKKENVLERVSLNICKGRTVAVVGESGSGKSTLARVIAGLLIPTQGSIQFKGNQLKASVKQRSKEDLRNIQIIYQMPDTALNPRQKIKQILGRPLSFYFGMSGEEKEKRVFELLEMIELPRKYNGRYPSELSGGEKQRICIARALAAEPELIICDEVTSALDQCVAEEILKLLQRLQDKLGVTYLFITHDLATVKVISDEVVVMLKGEVVESGTRDEVLNPPYHKYTENLLMSVPEMDPEWLDNLLKLRSIVCSESVITQE